MRDLPPSNQDGPFGYEPDQISNLDDDGAPPTTLAPDEAVAIAREAYDTSTNWISASRRARWSDSLKAFNGIHPAGSKYLSREYSGRSNLYRPKTRAMVRKGEASTATAFFSNEDVLSVKADDDDDPRQQASAEVLKALIQYRLTKTIPWFQTVIGARQDAEVMGICVAKVWWDYREKSHGVHEKAKLDAIHQMPLHNDDGTPQSEQVERYEIIKDEPRIDLISPENIRYDPGADWRDPINTSPYVIELIPMFYQDIMAKIDSGEWLDVGGSAIRGSQEQDSTKYSRDQGRQSVTDKGGPTAFSTCWVRSNIVNWNGQDWHFFTIGGGGNLLSNPTPLEDVYLHGQRPYVVGNVNIETHRNYPASKVELTRDLQRIANDDLNLRFDAVKMSLNPRQFVNAGAGVELSDLRSFTPGKIITVRTNKGEPPSSVVAWDRPPEPGQSSYAEAQQNQLDFDELSGSFTNASVQASQWSQQSATGMHLMSGEASGVSEYELRIFAETFVEPVLAMLIKLEQAYETNEVILALAGNKAQLFQRFGIDKVTDDLLDCAVTTKVNVGIGATNPSMRLRAFQQAAQILQQVFASPVAAMGLNFHEVLKEIMANAGYRDGERFIKPGFDPETSMQQMEQAKSGGKNGDQGQAHIQAATITAQSKLKEAEIHAQIEQRKLDNDLEKAKLVQDAENWRTKYAQDSQAQAQAVPQQAEILQQALPNIEAMAAAGQQTAQSTQAVAHQLQTSHTGLAVSHANLAKKVDELHNHTAGTLAAMGQHIANLHATHANTQRHIAHLTNQISAPRVVTRGPDGKVTGVQIAPNPNPDTTPT